MPSGNYRVPEHPERDNGYAQMTQVDPKRARHAPVGSSKPPKGGKGRGWRVLYRASIVVLVIAILAIVAIVAQYWLQQKAYEELHKFVDVPDTEEVALEDLTVDWDSLRAINPDIVGWIYIPDTIVNYPIVQGETNDTYLRRAFDQPAGSYATAGTIFLDSANKPDFSDRNNAIYGHHMHDGSMFKILADWREQSEFDAHRTIFILTPNGNFRLSTFALVLTVGTDPVVQTEFGTEESYESYVSDKISRSEVVPAEGFPDATEVRETFMLATCEYSQDNGRSILYAQVVESTVTGNPWISPTRDGGSTGVAADNAGLNDIGVL